MYLVDKDSDIPMYQQLYQAMIEEMIRSPEHAAPLPSIRSLARDMGISNNTVIQAYQQLLAEGYIYSVPGSGYFCNELILIGAAHESKTDVTSGSNVQAESESLFNFQYGNLENAAFPWPKWKECLKEALFHEESSSKLIYGDKQGLYELREAIASLLLQSRGVKCCAEQVVICSGVQDALRMLRVLLPAGDYTMGFEEPGYSTGRNEFLHNGYTIHPLKLSQSGLAMDELINSNCNLVYLTPSHQFPTGHIMPIGTRYKMLSYIEKVGGYIIEDDYDSEFRYRAKPIPSLQSLDANDRVIYLGTFSKSFSPTVRVAYMVLPRRLLQMYNTQCKDFKTPVATMIQHALYLFISRGYYQRHVRKLVKANERKYNRILSLFNQSAPHSVKPIFTDSGVHILLEFDTTMTETELLCFLEDQNIRLYPTSHYWLEESEHPVTLQMGFASMSLDELEAGLRKLFDAIADF